MRKREKKVDRDYVTNIKDASDTKRTSYPTDMTSIHGNPSGVVETRLNKSGKVRRRGNA